MPDSNKPEYRNIAIVGASGGLGSAFVRQFSQQSGTTVHAICRTLPEQQLPGVDYHAIKFTDELAIQRVANVCAALSPIDLTIVCTGTLSTDKSGPEKSLRDLNLDYLSEVYEINTIIPTLFGKHFLPKLNKHRQSAFAVLSARVGSIGDNRLGGWHGYRASKAALNMIIKNFSIEMQYKNKQAIIVALHPGTVDTPLSKPFQKNVASEKLFDTAQSVQYLTKVIDSLSIQDRGKFFAWDGKEVVW